MKVNYHELYLKIYKTALYLVAIKDIVYFEVKNLIQEYITLLTYFDSYKNNDIHLFLTFSDPKYFLKLLLKVKKICLTLSKEILYTIIFNYNKE